MPNYAGETHLLTKKTDLNPVHGGILETLVHETIHQLLTPSKSSFIGTELHELMILKYEEALVAYINCTTSAQAFWYPRCLNLMDPK